ncbi:hypothetical protein [Salinarimonas ramus]|uniref:Uncharacterized protein n=1 Tax=Salinarimonas ramus TaxID=690164 RepID=A0A917QAJ9_9HYPH|nr:hypothetical protein [Salinarimonas ramus]GGK39049.1 hypothetical protein GCM10011322_27670 [Salinarimonas ramus]
MSSVTTTGATEAIWHFAGYLHLIDEVARSWTLYDDDWSPRAPEEITPPIPALLEAPLIDPMTSVATPWWGAIPLAPVQTPVLLMRMEHAFALPKRGFEPAGPQDDPVLRPPVPPLSGSMLYRAQIVREDATGATVAQVTQLNRIDDSDTFVWGENRAADLLGIDPALALSDLLETARNEIPEDLRPLRGQDDLAGALVARKLSMADEADDADLAQQDGADDADATTMDPDLDEPGIHVDGVRVDEDWERPSLEPRAGMPDERNGHEAAGAHAELGANEAINAAIIEDLNELSLQTIVYGDHYRLDAIVQVNAIMDIDSLEQFGMLAPSHLAGLAGVSVPDATERNEVINIAEFVARDVDLGALELPGFGGMRWTVDVLDGDFWDVKAAYQTNLMIDDDLYSKTDYSAFSQVRMGENLSVNYLDFTQLGGDYDLIVIGGNYYAANWIVQANVLLDSDALLVGHDGGFGRQTISTSANQLTNDALIATYGGGEMVALGSGLAGFLPKLMSEDSLDPAEWWAVNGIGSGSMRVLWVTGDYYDINLLSQLNVVSDADALAQILPFYAAHGADGAEQWIATGGNRLMNSAIIVDTEAAVATHVGGGIYEEDFLVQAEIVIDGDDYDDDGLAPELVAFTGGEDMPFDDDGLFGAGPIAGQGDMMGSVMT